jgi:hypothetical protein
MKVAMRSGQVAIKSGSRPVAGTALAAPPVHKGAATVWAAIGVGWLVVAAQT